LSSGSPRPALPFRPSLRLALAVLPLVAACGAQASGGGPAGNGPAAGVRKVEPTLVVAATVERREMVRYLETTTRVESEREITIHPEVAGFVTAIRAEEGDAVEAGDVLCELDAADEELAKRDAEVALQEAREGERQPTLDRAEAEAMRKSARLAWQQAERDHERDQRLFESKEVASPVSRQTLEGSRLAMETAQSEHEQADIALAKSDLAAERAATAVARAEVALSVAERSLAQRTIRAPFAGQIATRSVRLGQSVGPSDAIFVLTDVEHVRAVFYRAQEELALFHPDAAALRGSDDPAEAPTGSALTFEARTEALPGVVFTGRVIRVSPTIDRDSGQFRVTGEFDRPEAGEPPLLPGMLVRLRIATDRHPNALVAPKRAVRREGDFTYVLVIDADGSVARVQVQEGYETDALVELIPRPADALSAGDRLVSVGSRELEDGDLVRVEGDPDGAEAAGDAAAAKQADDDVAGAPGDDER
jgi:HlyD family secretion protein